MRDRKQSVLPQTPTNSNGDPCLAYPRRLIWCGGHRLQKRHLELLVGLRQTSAAKVVAGRLLGVLGRDW